MSKDKSSLGLDPSITRRDFIGGTLIGSGAPLLGMPIGRQSWGRAAQESRRALKQVLEVIA